MTAEPQSLLRSALVKVLLDLTMPEFSEQNGLSDFARPRWSVINSEICAASGLTYAEAVEKLRELSETMSGLCVVTDAAANRLRRARNRDDQDEREDLSRKSFAEML